jgi:hypothetical protein
VPTLWLALQIFAALSRALICAHTLPEVSDLRGAFSRALVSARTLPEVSDLRGAFSRALVSARTLPEVSDLRGAFSSALICAHTLPEDSDLRGALPETLYVLCPFPRLAMCSHFARRFRSSRRFAGNFIRALRFPAPCDVLTLCQKIQIFAALFGPWYLPALCQKFQICAALSRALICAHTLPEASDIRGAFPATLYVLCTFPVPCDVLTLCQKLQISAALFAPWYLPKASDIRGASPRLDMCSHFARRFRSSRRFHKRLDMCSHFGWSFRSSRRFPAP